MGFCGYDELFNRKKFSWFTVTCELLMVKWVSPGESGKISRELLLQGHCFSFSSFQRLGHTKQISTVIQVSRRMLSPQSPGMDLQLKHLRAFRNIVIYWWFLKKLTEVSDRKVQQSCGFIMKKLNLTKVVSSVAEGAGISFKMDYRGKWWKLNTNNSFFYSCYITSISLYYLLLKCLFIRGEVNLTGNMV